MAKSKVLSEETMNFEERVQLALFLDKISLLKIGHHFIDEGVTMDVLLNMDDTSLKEIGIKKFGYRKRITQAANILKEERGKSFIEFER